MSLLCRSRYFQWLERSWAYACIGAGSTTLPNTPTTSLITTLGPVAGCNDLNLARDLDDGHFEISVIAEALSSGVLHLVEFVNESLTLLTLAVSFLPSLY